MDKTLPIFLYLIAAYGVLVSVLYLMQAYLIFAPYLNSPPRLEDTSIANTAQPISIQAQDGTVITSWIIPPEDRKHPIIIFFHGNAIHALHEGERARFFAAEGYGYVLAEYRGYGGNNGTPSEAHIYDDTQKLIARIKTSYPDHPLIFYGASIGTGIAVEMATRIPASAVILEAPYTSVAEVAKTHYFFVPVDLLLRHRFDSIHKISEINAPLLIIHGAKDRTIPARFGQALYQAATDPKAIRIIDDAGHNDLLAYGAHNISLSFINKATKKPAAKTAD